jgi:parvulin-like peptidyl-prolyl isomerase
VLAGAEREPSDGEVAAFYAEHADVFRTPGRVRVAQLFFGDGREADAEGARRRLDAGDDFDALRAAADPEPLPVPETPLPAARLVDYLGSTVARAALALPRGGVAGPLRSGWGYHLVRVEEREDAAVPSLDQIRDEVRAELRRQAGDRRLREYVDGLRAAADVLVREALP